MAAKKNTAHTSAVPDSEAPEVAELTAEEQFEAEAEMSEVLADLPALRPPHELRLAARNKVKTIYLEHGRNLAKIIGDAKEGTNVSDLSEAAQIEYLKHMMGVQEAIDNFAESIAIDKPGYIAWSNAHADDYAPFIALLARYASAVGESPSSAS